MAPRHRAPCQNGAMPNTTPCDRPTCPLTPAAPPTLSEALDTTDLPREACERVVNALSDGAVRHILSGIMLDHLHNGGATEEDATITAVLQAYGADLGHTADEARIPAPVRAQILGLAVRALTVLDPATYYMPDTDEGTGIRLAVTVARGARTDLGYGV